MLEARSIYRGGNLVAATDCDFESYKQLGLICPFCDQPVFLVKPAVKQRQKSGKVYYTEAHFSHYPGGDPLEDDCEKRSRTKEGQQWLDNIRTERRNQRLELFNLYFWDMVRDSNSYPKAVEKMSQKRVGFDNFDRVVRSLQEWWNGHREEVYKLANIAHNQLVTPAPEMQAAMQDAIDKVGEERALAMELDRLCFSLAVDQKLHQAIVYEAIDFLGTRKAGIAFRKMVAAAIYSDATYNAREYSSYHRIATHLPCQLANTRWLEQLEQKANQKPKGFGR